MSRNDIKKERKYIRKEFKRQFPKYMAAHIYVLPLLERLKIAWMIIKKG